MKSKLFCMVKNTCVYCGAQFSRAWNMDRHIKHIHTNHQNQGYHPRILAYNGFETVDTLSIASNQNIRNNRSLPNSYQKEATYHNTGIIGDNNGVQDVNWNSIYSNSQSDPNSNLDDEKIEYYTLVFLLRIKLWKFDRLVPNPYSPRAIRFKRYLWSRCITAENTKPLDDVLRKLRERI